MASSSPAMKVQLFLMQAWAVAFLHVGNWAFPMSAPFYFSLCDRAVVLLTWMSITWEIQTPWGREHKWKSGWMCVREFHALHLASWRHQCSQTHSGIKGILQQPVSTRNVDVISSVPWNIPISLRLQGGISIALGFNWDTLYLLLVILLLIFFSFHQFLTDYSLVFNSFLLISDMENHVCVAVNLRGLKFKCN